MKFLIPNEWYDEDTDTFSPEAKEVLWEKFRVVHVKHWNGTHSQVLLELKE